MDLNGKPYNVVGKIDIGIVVQSTFVILVSLWCIFLTVQG